MIRALRTAALALVAALAACGSDDAAAPGLLLSEPSAVAVFRGLTPKRAEVHPYLAIANSGSNDLTIVDAADDAVVLAPVPLRPLVFPVPGRPALLASASLGDGKPDLLVAVSAGDSRLQVLRTWVPDGAVAFAVELGADVLALVSIPSAEGTARIAAALSGEGIAVVEFRRQAGGDAIEQAAVQQAAGLGFQPVALAAMPDGDPAPDAVQTTLYAASPDLDGVAELGVPAGAAPVLGPTLDAGAPTRLVAAARLMESPASAVRDQTAFAGAPVERVYAVLDESGCGPAAPIACGLVALDPVTGALVPDPFFAATTDLAPIPFAGSALALAAVPPPSEPPSDADPVYADTFMRVQTAAGIRATTGVAAVASTTGDVYFVDLGRWELPGEQVVHTQVGATEVSSPQGAIPGPTGSTPVDQWLVLFDPRTSTTVAHSDAAGLAAAVEVTPGFTPTERWTVTYQGALPGLSSRRAQATGGGPILALQVPVVSGGFTEIVRLHDPTLGVALGDTVVVDATGAAPGLSGCTTTFEAEVQDILAPAAGFPGGAVLLAGKSDPAHPEWDACVAALAGAGPTTGLRASILAGEYVLVKGSGAAAAHVGRPVPGVAFAVEWAAESTGTCTLPPAAAWPVLPALAPACDATCRFDCEALVRVRMARRLGYVTETCGTDARCLARWPSLPAVSGPAVGFTLALENPAVDPPRGLTLTIETDEGRAPFKVAPSAGGGLVAPRAVAVFDRSPHIPGAGVRIFVPYAGGVVLDATPTVQGGNPVLLR